MIVVDASLAAKWMLWEADTPAAIAFLSDYENLVAPDLLFIEVAGAIVRRGNENKAIQPDALRALEKWTIAWSDHVVKNYRVTQRRLFTASRLALLIGNPLKDCIYLALAMELKCDLATCEERFRSKALPVYSAIRLLGEYQTGDEGGGSGAPPTSL